MSRLIHFFSGDTKWTVSHIKGAIRNKGICLLLLLSILVAHHAKGQHLKTVTLIEQRSHYLNGGARSMVGGKSRVTIEVDIPVNTVYWYYSITTTPSDQGTQILNLGLQIGAMVATSGAASVALSQIKIPPGSGSADVYLMSETDVPAFLNKNESISYFRDVSLENIRHAVQRVPPEYGAKVYLGLRNPATFDPVTIQIEVVAVVSESNPPSDKATTYCNLGWAAYERGDLEKCIVLSEKALMLDPNLSVAQFNIALVHLAWERDDVLDKYIDAVASLKTQAAALSILKGALDDIGHLNTEKPGLKNLQDIETLLISEAGKY
jgi:tetratricopeptide (TPR) repeat protein